MIRITFGLEEEVIMNRAYTIGREMTNSEKQAWLNGVSLVKRVEVVKKQSVAQPSNIEAIVEGLLYIVGEDGAKGEQLAEANEKSIEDTKTILSNIQKKYASETYGIELVGYGSVYKFGPGTSYQIYMVSYPLI